MDLSGPFIKGMPVTDRREKEELWPRYMVVGAFVPFSPKEVQDRYDQERRDRIAAGLEGPVQMETTVSQKGQTLYFVEVVSSKETKNTSPAILRIISRINNLHKCKAVYRLHADRARELTGEAARNTFEEIGVTVTSTANYDSNANGRAERAVLFFQEESANVAIYADTFRNLSKPIKEAMDICSAACRGSTYK